MRRSRQRPALGGQLSLMLGAHLPCMAAAFSGCEGVTESPGGEGTSVPIPLPSSGAKT